MSPAQRSILVIACCAVIGIAVFPSWSGLPLYEHAHPHVAGSV